LVNVELRNAVSRTDSLNLIGGAEVNSAHGVEYRKKYGGEDAGFSSLLAKEPQSAILNLEQGEPVTSWGRLIFHVTDVDALWNHLKDRGFDPEIPRDASWGERYFDMPDPDGHELSFAHPYKARRMNVVKRPVADAAPESEGRPALFGILFK